MVTPEDPAQAPEPSVDAASGGEGTGATGARDGTPGPDRPWQRTDAANRELVAQLYGDHVRYDHRRGHWLLWGGHWWRLDETGQVRILAKEAARLRYEKAIRIARPTESPLHPTMKPLPLIERAIANSSDPGSFVLDSFMGSGSTLIACERTGRISAGVELDPRYCDVIVARWEAFTGLTAEPIDG